MGQQGVDYETAFNAAKQRIELFRGRARSAAGLTGAGAGALAAGLVLSPAGANLPFLGRLLGLASVILLIVGTGLFVTASLKYSNQDRNAEPLAGEALIQQSDSLFESVKSLMKWAKWVSGVSVLALILSLTALALLPPEEVNVAVGTIERQHFVGCDALPEEFDARTTRDMLLSGSEFVELKLEPGVCGESSGPTSIIVLRSAVSLSWRT
ncbi:hypothetical protein [Cryobacterium sp. TMT4-31]|uniref:hypothetical protein n=1 Tax=Cryobacterium sp. TMT4-31 TaxID=1259259 RepID=UPI00106907B8|nr:hypothetical protein [Cryobacterium sp. TMT4-31]TFC87457.1 hypothetical protein E3T19_12545 [Cryobacterium sp. TMT4-31]